MHRSHILAVILATPLLASGLGSWHLLANEVDADTSWVSQTSSDGSTAVARHEAGAVAIGDLFFLMGGRSNRPVDIYDAVTRRWVTLERAPVDIHHFQPVAVGTDIYAIGAQVGGGFPDEPSEPDIYVYDTTTFTWTDVGEIPEDRRRGSAGAVVRDGIIYIVGGNTKGHNGGAIPWLDSYDPETKVWTRLADAPNARDHFTAVIVDDKLIAAGGRQSTNANGDVFANTVAGTDVYDFDTMTWTEGADIPTMRAGALTAGAGMEVYLAGGERSDNELALSVVEAYNVQSNQWRSLQNMIDARHSGGSAIIGTQWHVVAGSVRRGGGSTNEISRHETLELGIAPDADNDGLSDSDEASIYSTDANDPDTDDDELNDGVEVGLGSDPLNNDTDGDGLLDGPEVNDYLSSPLLMDTDADGLSDAAEVLEWQSNPNVADTDGDNLSDGDEVERGLSPILADTDEDGLDDGAEIVAGTDPLDPDTDEDGLLDGEDPEPLVADTSETETEVATATQTDTDSSTATTDETAKSASSSKTGVFTVWLLGVFAGATVLRKTLIRRQRNKVDAR